MLKAACSGSLRPHIQVVDKCFDVERALPHGIAQEEMGERARARARQRDRQRQKEREREKEKRKRKRGKRVTTKGGIRIWVADMPERVLSHAILRFH
jgi:hypothetical protein